MALDGTLAGMRASIAEWLNREDLTDAIPDFMTMARKRIGRRLRVAAMEITATAMLTDGAVALPNDFIELRTVTGTPRYGMLSPTTPDAAGNDYASNTAGVPGRYAVVGNTLRTYPNGGTGPITIVYYAEPTEVYLLTKAPDLYLYGSLLESAPYLGDDARLQTWSLGFEAALNDLQNTDARARYGNSVCRVRGPTP